MSVVLLGGKAYRREGPSGKNQGRYTLEEDFEALTAPHSFLLLSGCEVSRLSPAHSCHDGVCCCPTNRDNQLGLKPQEQSKKSSYFVN